MVSPIPRLSTIGIPKLGFGAGSRHYKPTSDPIDEGLMSNLVKALDSGINHIDAAERYNTTIEIAKALKQTKVTRSDIWITDKYFSGDSSYTYRPKHANPYLYLRSALETLDTPYVDLYLLHTPFIKKETHGFDLVEAWGFMEQCKKEGLAKNIGVSNFTVEHLKTIMANKGSEPISVNQIEYNAFLQDQTPGVVELCQQNNILVEAYSPLGPLYKGDLTKGVGKEFDLYLDELVSKYGKSKTKILLRWVAHKGIIPITTTSKESRLAEFLDVYTFELNDEEVNKITGIGKSYKPSLRQYWKPEYSKFD